MTIDPAGFTTSPSGARISLALGTPMKQVVPDDVDIAALSRGLADDHVVAPADQTAGLSRVVTQARDDGHQMFFVVLGEKQPKFTYYRDIATALQKQTGGTVVVFGPDTLGTASDDFSRVQLEQAQDNLSVADPSQAAGQLLDRVVEQPQIPWTAVTGVLIVIAVVGAVAARAVQIRRRRRPTAGPASDSGETTTDDTLAASGGDGVAETEPGR